MCSATPLLRSGATSGLEGMEKAAAAIRGTGCYGLVIFYITYITYIAQYIENHPNHKTFIMSINIKTREVLMSL